MQIRQVSCDEVKPSVRIRTVLTACASGARWAITFAARCAVHAAAFIQAERVVVATQRDVTQTRHVVQDVILVTRAFEANYVAIEKSRLCFERIMTQ